MDLESLSNPTRLDPILYAHAPSRAAGLHGTPRRPFRATTTPTYHVYVHSRLEIIAEVGQTYQGDPDLAKQAAQRFAIAGATAIKYQWLQPDRIASPTAARYWDTNNATSQTEAFTTAGTLAYDQWGPVIRHCRTIGVDFLTTPFDVDACQAAADYGLTTLKIASGDVNNWQLIDAAVAAVGPEGRLIISTGATLADEAKRLLPELAGRVAQVTLLACSLAYPTQHRVDWALGRIGTLDALAASARGSRTRWDVGYSDHTLSLDTGALAVAAGATCLERHVTLGGDPNVVADHAMALDPEGFAAYAVRAREAERATQVRSLHPTSVEEAARHGARRCLYARTRIEPGDRYTTANVETLRPGPVSDSDMAASAWRQIEGQRASRSWEAGELLQYGPRFTIPIMRNGA